LIMLLTLVLFAYASYVYNSHKKLGMTSETGLNTISTYMMDIVLSIGGNLNNQINQKTSNIKKYKLVIKALHARVKIYTTLYQVMYY
jgi:hypothetical protein